MSDRLEHLEQIKRDLREAFDDLIVLMLTEPTALLNNYEQRQKRIEPIVEEVDRLINF